MHHKWLDAAGSVQGHPDLNMWTAHSDLGRIVTEIVNELQKEISSNPEIKQAASPARSTLPAPVSSITSYPRSTVSYASASRQPAQQTSNSSKVRRTQMPVIPTTFLELEELSLSQLENLNSDERALEKFVSELASVTDFTQLRDEILHSNMGTAMKTLGYETELRDLQKAVELQRTELQAAQQVLAEKQARQQRIAARHRPDALLEQLSAAAKSLDTESDEIAMQFTQGDIDVVQFLSTFLTQRNLYHERTLKLACVHQY